MESTECKDGSAEESAKSAEPRLFGDARPFHTPACNVGRWLDRGR